MRHVFRLRNEVEMERTPLLPLPEGMFIDHIQEGETSLIIEVMATQETSCCPLCSQASSSVHSHYHRTVADVPCGGRQIQLSLSVRKFFCRNPLCARKVFTERLPTLVEPWARMTIRLTTSSTASTRVGEKTARSRNSARSSASSSS